MCHVQTQRFKGLVLVYCEWFGQFWVKNAWIMTLKAGWECMSLHKYWEKTVAVMNLLDFCKKIYLHNVGFFSLFMKVLSASMWCIRQDHAVSALQSKPCTYIKDHWPLWLHWDLSWYSSSLKWILFAGLQAFCLSEEVILVPRTATSYYRCETFWITFFWYLLPL